MSLDNIEKQSDSVEQDPSYADFLREEAAFERLLPELLSTIPGRYMAMLDGKVIDQDKNEFTLAERISGRCLERFVLIRRVSREPEDYSRRRRTIPTDRVSRSNASPSTPTFSARKRPSIAFCPAF